jgi:hypothetical protein
MTMLACEKYRQMVKGGVQDRLAVATSTLPDECASELFLVLSKDSIPDVRAKVASNQSIPKDSICRVLGRLHKDKAIYVRNSVRDNIRFNTECDGGHEMDYIIEPWYGFDVIRADAHCKNGCNYQRLIGELEVQDVAVVSIHDWKATDHRTLKDLGFDFIPTKITWQLNMSEYNNFDEYLDTVKKGDYIRHRLKRFEKENIYYLVREVNDRGEGDKNYYKQWYALYRGAMESKKRGRLIIKENEVPRHLTAIYAVKDGDTVLGGILFNKSKPNVISGAYGAFVRQPVGLSDVAMAMLAQHALSYGGDELNLPYRIGVIPTINLGMDTNFYGFHLGTGLYSFKKSLGYVPRQFRDKKEYFKVLDDRKFDNPYMYLGFPPHVEETDEDFHSFGLENNIFIKGDAKISLEQFNAPEGIRITHNGEKQGHFFPKKDEFFQKARGD